MSRDRSNLKYLVIRLGMCFNKKGRDNVTSRINNTRRIIKSLKRILWSKQITKQRKISIYNTYTYNEYVVEMDVLRRVNTTQIRTDSKRNTKRKNVYNINKYWRYRWETTNLPRP